MKLAVPHTPSPLFALTALLGLFFCLSAANAATLKLMIPPGHSELDDLQKAYEQASKDLQASFETVQKNAPACENGAKLSQLVSKGVPWQKAQRERILKALNQSTADLQTQIAALDQTAADGGSAGAGISTVAVSKNIIADGIDKPKNVIQKELPSVQTFALRIGVSHDAASQLLSGDSPACAKARETFIAKLKPQADALSEKLKKLLGALTEHKTALNTYADSVSESLVKKGGRAPASLGQ